MSFKPGQRVEVVEDLGYRQLTDVGSRRDIYAGERGVVVDQSAGCECCAPVMLDRSEPGRWLTVPENKLLILGTLDQIAEAAKTQGMAGT